MLSIEQTKNLRKNEKVIRYDGRIGCVVSDNDPNYLVIQWDKENFSTHTHNDIRQFLIDPDLPSFLGGAE